MNRQKLLQTLQTKKTLDTDERKLIIDLSKRGFLPKGLENDPVIVESLMEESLQNGLSKNKSSDNQGTDGGALDSNSSPPNPKLQHGRSNEVKSTTNFAFGGTSSSNDGNSQIGSSRDLTGRSRDNDTHGFPKINVQRPRLNTL